MDKSLLPPNASALERVLEQCGAGISDIPVPINTLWSPKTCPAKLLPWLADSVSVDEWDSHWPEPVKRQVIADSVPLHRKKGTVGAVRRALASVDIKVDVKTGVENNCAPNGFRVIAQIDDRGIDQNTIKDIQRLVEPAKQQSTFYTIEPILTSNGSINADMITLGIPDFIVPAWTPSELISHGQAHSGGVPVFSADFVFGAV